MFFLMLEDMCKELREKPFLAHNSVIPQQRDQLHLSLFVEACCSAQFNVLSPNETQMEI